MVILDDHKGSYSGTSEGGSYSGRLLYWKSVLGQGETVINILSDLNGFWSYENREMILAENPEEEQ